MASVKIVAGTRGSKLSLIQTDLVIQLIRDAVRDIEVSTRVIRTIGDVMVDKHILSISSEGVFEKEVNRAVSKREVDFAVHSMKDLPTEYDSNIMIAAVPRRESPFDTLVSKEGYSIEDLPRRATVGTGSPRREAQIRYLRPDLKIKPIRGNVDTRVRKLEEGLYDAVILAEAGVSRLSIDCKMTRLPLEDFTPAPGQGALAITIRKDRGDLAEIFSRINHPPSLAEITAERAFLSEIGGGCKVPIGALARAEGDRLSIRAVILLPDGSQRFQFTHTGGLYEPEEVGKKVGEELIRETGGVAEMVKRSE
ncbi:MAG: hydroxymethylbilane synthase [Nitrososphaerales archaeon]